jgi:MFS family permease
MRDWNALVRERLGELGLKAAQQDEIIAELAGHLEDMCEELRALGLCESDAFTRVLNEVGDWRGLAQKLHCAKRGEKTMNQRTKSVWLPGLISLIVASLFLMILEKIGVRPKIWWPSGFGLAVHLPWLIAQPALGALGAYLSHRAGGDRRARLAAGLFPSIVMLGAFCLMALIGFVISILVHWPVSIRLTLIGFAIYVCFWVVLPGLGLLLGALPFLREQKAAALPGN